jgi:hypothetical protein
VQRVDPDNHDLPLAVPRAAGASDVLYVGEGRDYRPVQLFHRRHPANIKLGRLAHALHHRGEPLYVRVWVKGCTDKAAATLAEAKLLNQITLRCGEMPPCNSRWEGWVVPQLLEALAAKAIKKSTTGSWTAGAPYAWGPDSPDNGPAATLIDIFEGAGPQDHLKTQWHATIAWVWPASWHTLQHNDDHRAVVQPERLLLAVPPDSTPAGHLLPAGAPLGWTSDARVTHWTLCPLVDDLNEQGTPRSLGELLDRVDGAEEPRDTLSRVLPNLATASPRTS